MILINSFKGHCPADKQCKNAAHLPAVNRRAVTFFPSEHFARDGIADLSFTNKLPLLPQLLRIEAKQASCCIKVECERRKSRAAVLIYRGRAIACIYGRKSEPDQEFGQNAYQRLMAECSSPGAAISSYHLPDEVVMAAASMFHGGVFAPHKPEHSLAALAACTNMISRTGAPGAIAIFDTSNQLICLSYVMKGQVIGIHSLTTRSKFSDNGSILHHLAKHPKTLVVATSMAFADYRPNTSPTFDLVGFEAPQPFSSGRGHGRHELADLLTLRSIKPSTPPIQTQKDRFIQTRSDVARKLNSIIAYDHPYRIDPSF